MYKNSTFIQQDCIKLMKSDRKDFFYKKKTISEG